MLRLPQFSLLRPATLDEALALSAEHGSRAQLIAGGTDLLPNMKHGLFEPEFLISLQDIKELRGIRRAENGDLCLGAMTTLASLAANDELNRLVPALTQAAGLVAGPQIRSAATLGGNILLDTRCQWYNQTHFWRQALGYCLKKDGSLCHVIEGGKKCVAAASCDSAPALMVLDAELVFESARGKRQLAIRDLWRADGALHLALEPGEILVRVRVPAAALGRLGAYGKLRDRNSIDFPLLGVAARLDIDGKGLVSRAELCVTALAARPLAIGLGGLFDGLAVASEAFARATERAGALAYKRCHPLANIPGDPEWRREMVPLVVRRTLAAAAQGSGPVHPV